MQWLIALPNLYLRDGGLFLSSAGFASPVYRHLGKLTQSKFKLGNKEKIVSLCQHYVRVRDGIWYQDNQLTDSFFEHTLN